MDDVGWLVVGWQGRLSCYIIQGLPIAHATVCYMVLETPQIGAQSQNYILAYVALMHFSPP